MNDVIDELAGIVTGSPVDMVRNLRPVTRENAQKSWIALFQPSDVSHVSLVERFAVATFVALLHQNEASMEFYGSRLASLSGGDDVRRRLVNLAESSQSKGPYGAYPPGPLTRENLAGPVLSLSADHDVEFGPRLAAALEHSHLLVLHPRDARPAHLQRLLIAGWSTTGIVTLSQLVSFLTFQIRVTVGLRALAISKEEVA